VPPQHGLADGQLDRRGLDLVEHLGDVPHLVAGRDPDGFERRRGHVAAERHTLHVVDGLWEPAAGEVLGLAGERPQRAGDRPAHERGHDDRHQQGGARQGQEPPLLGLGGRVQVVGPVLQHAGHVVQEAVVALVVADRDAVEQGGHRDLAAVGNAPQDLPDVGGVALLAQLLTEIAVPAGGQLDDVDVALIHQALQLGRLPDLVPARDAPVAPHGRDQGQAHAGGDLVELPGRQVDELDAPAQRLVLDARRELARRLGERRGQHHVLAERLVGDRVELGDDAGTRVAVDPAALDVEAALAGLQRGEGGCVGPGHLAALALDLCPERSVGRVGLLPGLVHGVHGQVDEVLRPEQEQARVVPLVLDGRDEAARPDGRGGQVGLLAHVVDGVGALDDLEPGHGHQHSQRHAQRDRRFPPDGESYRHVWSLHTQHPAL
jgi:hypothetical protein